MHISGFLVGRSMMARAVVLPSDDPSSACARSSPELPLGGDRVKRPPRLGALTLLAASLLLSVAWVHSFAADSAVARRTLTADDFFRVRDLSDPQVSPDGLWVAYVVNTNDRAADAQRSAIWMARWDGSQQLALTAAASDTDKPRWSPDGRSLAFLTSPAGSDTLQLMLLDRRG